MSIPRSQIRLGAITGSIASVDSIADRDYTQPVGSSAVAGNNLESILASMAGAIKRIHGTGSFTAANAGVFTHAEATFTGDLKVDGGDLKTSATSATVFDQNADTIYMGGEAEYVGIGAPAGIVDMAGDVRLTGSIDMIGAGLEKIDRVGGGNLLVRGGDLTGSIGKVWVELSGSELHFQDGYATDGGWSGPLSLGDSTTDWQRFKNIFGEASILSAISTAAALPTDAKFMFKVTNETGSITGAQLQQVNGSHFSASFQAVPVASRDENVDVFLNGQLLVSKSFNSGDYDYDISSNGSSISFNFNLQPDDFVSVLVPVTVASVADYVAGNGAGGGGGAGATNLDGLTDVTISSPAIGQVLKYNGSAWVNDTDAGGAGAGSMSVCDFAVGTSTVSSSTSIPANSLPISIMFQVTSAYSNGTTISIGNVTDGASSLMSSSDILPGTPGIYMYDLSNISWTSTNTLLVTINGSPVAGAGRVRFVYSSSPNS